nr:translation initiation factor IF-3, mitochondrial isoform X2 [Paramormyrops kingsleyae]
MSVLRWRKAVVQLFHSPLSLWRPEVFPQRYASNNLGSFLWRTSITGQLRQSSTDTGGVGSVVEEGPSGRQRQDPRARNTVSSIGRKIHHRHLQVIGASGENLGTMHRADVVRLMDQQGLKLVLLDQNQQPPVYRLMTGKQIHQEQLMLREKQKNRTGPVVMKELVFSTDISHHDLDTKLKQVQGWLEKKHHVRLTVRRGNSKSTEPLELELEQMVQGLVSGFGFVSRPQLIRDGKAAMCILRPPSKKELQQSKTPLERDPSGPAASDQSTPVVKSSPE